MQKIKIERYEHPEGAGFEGWIEPEDRSWVLFIAIGGAPLFYAHRAADGGVLCEGVGPHNVPRLEHLERLAAERLGEQPPQIAVGTARDDGEEPAPPTPRG